MNKIYKILGIKPIGICLVMLLVSISSCKKGLDINESPNFPNEVPLRTILPAAEANLAYTVGGSINRIGASFVQLYAGHRNQPLEYGQYDITPATTDNIWSSMYAGVLADLNSIALRSSAEGNTVYLGAAQILTAYTYSVLTDSYGDIPFSAALGGITNVNPAYDKQEAIYPAIIELLNTGITNVKSNQGNFKPGADDFIFGGDIVKWEKFANSLKLRLYNHTSKVNPTAALTFLNTNPLLMEANADNAALKFGTTASTSNPIYQFDVISGRIDNAVAATLVNKMKASEDPRIPVFFYPVENGALAGQYLGNVAGGDDDDSGSNKFSRVGSAYGATDAPVILMSYAELQYIIAEIRQRAGNTAGAADAYSKALDADFSFLGLASAAASYKARPEVVFNGTLQRIMEQKWVTMFQAPYESWTDWRRTGFPVLVPAVLNRTGGVIPRRFPYPQLEINLNGQSLANGPGIPVPYRTILIGVWWDR